MNSRLHKDIRRLLRSRPNGMSCTELAQHFGRRPSTAYNALKSMPDAYISHWEMTETFRHSAKWRVVVPPPNAKPPWKK